tara:strand:- start:1564 stop:1788 length:225 start_codon:yes stop_codon:yes gene_type:complete
MELKWGKILLSKKNERTIIALLRAIQKSISKYEEPIKEDTYIETESEPIRITEDVYNGICEELGTDSIFFMGIA